MSVYSLNVPGEATRWIKSSTLSLQEELMYNYSRARNLRDKIYTSKFPETIQHYTECAIERQRISAQHYQELVKLLRFEESVP